MIKTNKLVELFFVNPGALKELSINSPNLLAVWPALSYSIREMEDYKCHQL